MTNANSDNSSVKICSINICGLSPRSKHTLEKYSYDEGFDIVTVQETGSSLHEKLKLNNMKVISDTNNSYNRGAALYVREDCSCTELREISNLSKQVDSTWGLAVVRNKRYIVGNVYAKLNYKPAISEIIKMINAAEARKETLKAAGVILSGDFNARHPMWGDEVCNEYGKHLFEKLDHSKFSIITSKTPTFLCENGSSFIDLMIISKNLVSKVETCYTDSEVELFSGAPLRGHVPLIMKLNKAKTSKPRVTEKIDINSISWAAWRGDLENQIANDSAEIRNSQDPDDLWKYTESIINKITSKHSVTKKSTTHSKPYWTDNLTSLCNKMREARKAYQHRNTDYRKQEMIKTKEEFDIARKDECEKFIIEQTKSLNAAEATKFWKDFNRIFKNKADQDIDPLHNGNGGLVTEIQELEEIMFDTFYKNTHMNNADFDEDFHDSINEMYEEIKAEACNGVEEGEGLSELNADISVAEIKKAIKRTDANKTSIDNHQMSPKMLHHLGDNAVKLLQTLFNLSMNKSKWVWTRAEVIFLKKEGKESYAVPGSYRPISITSYVGKLLEKIIAARIAKYLYRMNLHDPDQEGFSSGRNTIRYLNRLNLEIKTDLLDKKTVIGLFVDMEKAFNSVWKKGLIVKLNKLNIKGKILKLIDSFLTSGMVKLIINGHKGDLRECEAYGLPQGSALAPMMFKVYLLDMFDDVKDNKEITVYKFADDGTAKIASETTNQCLLAFDRVILSIEKWTSLWRMIINCGKNKTEFVCFGTAEKNDVIPVEVEIVGKKIKRVQQTKVLGLIVDEKLTYIPHSKEVHRRLLGKWARLCQYSNIHWGFNQRVMRQLINTLFISSMQYAGHIYINTRNMEDINQIWYKLIKSSVGSIFNIKLSVGEVILGIPPISIQTTINRTKHYLKLNLNNSPEDRLKDYVTACVQQELSQPAELKSAMKEVFKFLSFKTDRVPDDFTEEDIVIISNKNYHQYFNLSPKACKYTKNNISKYTEKIWYEKLRNEGLMNGEHHTPKPSCSRVPIPHHTSRRDEVLLMSTMYEQNLMNSFVYRHTNTVESPLCPRCHSEEQTPHHVIGKCNSYSDEIQQLMTEILGQAESQHPDTTTILNCSRNPKFIYLCLMVLEEGEFRADIDLN